MRTPINISGMQMANQAIDLLLWDGATPLAPAAHVPPNRHLNFLMTTF